MAYKDTQKRKEYEKRYRLEHREARRRSYLKWLEKNRESSLKYQQEYHKNYEQKYNLPYKRAYNKQKYQTDIEFRLKAILRSRLTKAIRDKKLGSHVKDLGCTVTELKFYLEGKFQDGMSWGNYGKWHIDHVIPISFFDLSDRKQFLEACYYTNLQPLWASENLKKGNKLKEIESLI